MTEPTRKRGRRGEGTIYWDEQKKSYRGEITVGYKPNGQRIKRRRYGKTVGDVQDSLRKAREEYDAGITTTAGYSVGDCLDDWLARGRRGRDATTVKRDRVLIDGRIKPYLGTLALRDLTVDHVEDWLGELSAQLATSTLGLCLSILRRAVKLAQKRGRIGHNVVALVDDLPDGREGRPSKSLTLDQAAAVIRASQGRGWIRPYLMVSMLTGVRTEEARALRWEHVHLEEGNLPPHIEVWRSVRTGGDTKTPKSRRTLALPPIVVATLSEWREEQQESRRRNGHKHKGIIHVFGTRHDTVMNPNNVIRSFNRVLELAGLPTEWTPREFRHTFVSIMSAAGASDGVIADLVGHADTATTRRVYRHELRPVITEGAEIMRGFLAARGVFENP